jgi:hypothetical protein
MEKMLIAQNRFFRGQDSQISALGKQQWGLLFVWLDMLSCYNIGVNLLLRPNKKLY